jgi:hypothetical protein
VLVTDSGLSGRARTALNDSVRELVIADGRPARGRPHRKEAG